MNTLAGYIKLHRKMKNWRWKDHPPTLCLFIHLLLSASYETEYTGSGVVLTPGQAIISTRALATETGLTRMEIRTALSHLQQTGEITIDTKPGGRSTIVTIQNWNRYQMSDAVPSLQPSNQPSSESPESSQQRDFSSLESQEQPSEQPSFQPSNQPSEQPFIYYKKNIKKYKNNKEDINNNNTTRARAGETDFGPVQIDPLIIKVQQELNGLTDTHYMELDSFREELSDELISFAIDLTVENGVRNWSYVRAILESFVREQIRTIGEAKARDEKRKQQQKAAFPQRPQKVVSAQQYTQREYDEKKLEDQLGVNDLFKKEQG